MHTDILQVDLQDQELRQRLVALLCDNQTFLNGRHNQGPRNRLGKIAVRGVCGSYSDCIRLLRNNGLVMDTPAFVSGQCKTVQGKCILWLGSSMTNLPPQEATEFLCKLAADEVLNLDDTLLIGLDRCRDVEKVKDAYSEDSNCWQTYMKNGVRNAGNLIGDDATSKLDGGQDWVYVARWDSLQNKHMVRIFKYGSASILKNLRAAIRAVEQATLGDCAFENIHSAIPNMHRDRQRRTHPPLSVV